MRMKSILVCMIFIISGMIMVSCHKQEKKEAKIVLNNEKSQLDEQNDISQQIINQFNEGNYTIASPLLIQDPYKNSPLSYLLLFNTNDICQVSVTIEGRDSNADIHYQFDNLEYHHEIPLIGLYPDYINSVEIALTDADGQIYQQTYTIQTDKLPDDFPDLSIKQANKVELGKSLYIVGDSFYNYMFDTNGDIRWYQLQTSPVIQSTSDHHLFTYANLYIHSYYHEIREVDFLGKIYNDYVADGAVHHTVTQSDNHNIVVTALEKNDNKYDEDIVYILNNENGDIINKVDIKDYLDPTRFEGVPALYNILDRNDWYHLNGAVIDESDQTLVVSGRKQSIVAKIDYKNQQLKWILGPHDAIDPSLQPYLLTPIGSHFEWNLAEHSPKVLPDLDHNPDTTDILMFDNHTNIGVFDANEFPTSKQFSRAVHYRINEKNMTVEQIWEFGEEENFFSNVIGEVMYFENNNHVLLLSGSTKVDTNSIGAEIFEVAHDDTKAVYLEASINGGDTDLAYTLDKIEPSDLGTPFSLLLQGNTYHQNNINSQKNIYTNSEKLQSLNNNLFTNLTMNMQNKVLNTTGTFVNNTMSDDELYIVLSNTITGTNYYADVHPYDLIKLNDSLKVIPYYRLTEAEGNTYQFSDSTLLDNLENGKYDIYLMIKHNSQETYYDTPYTYEQ